MFFSVKTNTTETNVPNVMLMSSKLDTLEPRTKFSNRNKSCECEWMNTKCERINNLSSKVQLRWKFWVDKCVPAKFAKDKNLEPTLPKIIWTPDLTPVTSAYGSKQKKILSNCLKNTHNFSSDIRRIQESVLFWKTQKLYFSAPILILKEQGELNNVGQRMPTKM